MVQKIKNLVAETIVFIKQSQVLSRFLKVFSIEMLARIAGFACWFTIVYLTSKEEYGVYSYLLLVVTIVASIFNFGLYTSQIKIYHELDDEGKGRLFFSTNIFLWSVIFFVGLLSYFFEVDITLFKLIINEKNNIDYLPFRPYILPGIAIQILMVMATSYFTTGEKIKLLNGFNVTNVLGLNLFVLIGLLYFAGDNVLIMIKLFYIGQFLFLIIFYSFYLQKFKARFDKKLLLKSLRLGWPVMINSVWAIVYNFSDRLLLQEYGSFADVGVYSFAFKLASILTIILTSFQNVWQPFFFKEKNLTKNYQKTSSVVLKMIGSFVLVSVGIWAGMFLLLLLGYKEGYLAVLYIMPVMFISRTLNAVQTLYSNYTLYFEQTYINLFVGMFGNILNLGLNILLIPRFNIYGAVVATLISVAVSCLFYVLYVKMKVKKVTSQNKNHEQNS